MGGLDCFKYVRQTLILILFFSSFAFGQDDPYRFRFSPGYHTVMQWGFKDFSNVSSAYEHGYSLYKDAEWDISYDNFRFSHGFNFNFEWDYISGEKYLLRHSFGFFTNKGNEVVNFELVNVGDGQVNMQDSTVAIAVPVGFQNSSYQDRWWNGGFNTDLVFLFRLDHFNLGFGMNAYFRRAGDHFWTKEGFSPWSLPRASQSYTTYKGGVVFLIEKEFGRFTSFLKLSQSVVTLKSRENKGAKYFDPDKHIYPVSHNFDFRHPLIINAGISVAFDRI